MRLFVLYNLKLEIINFLYKNLYKAECYVAFKEFIFKIFF